MTEPTEMQKLFPDLFQDSHALLSGRIIKLQQALTSLYKTVAGGQRSKMPYHIAKAQLKQLNEECAHHFQMIDDTIDLTGPFDASDPPVPRDFDPGD